MGDTQPPTGVDLGGLFALILQSLRLRQVPTGIALSRETRHALVQHLDRSEIGPDINTSLTSLTLFVLGPQVTGAMAGAAEPPANTGIRRLEFPDNTKFNVLGLHWFDQNEPKLWRMPASRMESLPKGVQGRSKCPSGGRILLKRNATHLALRAAAVNGADCSRCLTANSGRPGEPVKGTLSREASALSPFSSGRRPVKPAIGMSQRPFSL